MKKVKKIEISLTGLLLKKLEVEKLSDLVGGKNDLYNQYTLHEEEEKGLPDHQAPADK